jgi:predicted nucleotidyltransferase
LVNLPFEVQFALIEFINEVLKFRGIVKVLLFGSYSKLIFTAKSDIDLAVILYDKFKNKTILEKKIFKITEKVSKKYKKHIETHFFEEKDLKHKEDPLIKDILRDGIVLI